MHTMINMPNHQPKSAQSPNLTAYLGLIIIFTITFFPIIRSLVETWIQSNDHSHGLLIVPVSLYIVWQKRNALKKIEIVPGRGGVLLVAFAIMLYVFGYLAEIHTISSFSLVITIWAIVWSLFGKIVFRAILFPMLLLLLMIPVPAQFYSMATIPLQLLVSKTSTFIGGFFGIPILREGNVLHLPGRTLAVVQACSGLRSLMSLVTVCAIFGYFTLSSNVLRSLLMVSSVPAAIIVNIMRVVIMIVAFQFFGFDLSKGTLHTAFGVVLFVLALLIVAMIRKMFSKWDIEPTAA